MPPPRHGLVATLSVTACATTPPQPARSRALRFSLAWGLVLVGALLTNLAGPGLVPYTLGYRAPDRCRPARRRTRMDLYLTGQIRVRQEEQQRITRGAGERTTAELKHARHGPHLARLLPIAAAAKIRDGRGTGNTWKPTSPGTPKPTSATASARNAPRNTTRNTSPSPRARRRIGRLPSESPRLSACCSASSPGSLHQIGANRLASKIHDVLHRVQEALALLLCDDPLVSVSNLRM